MLLIIYLSLVFMFILWRSSSSTLGQIDSKLGRVISHCNTTELRNKHTVEISFGASLNNTRSKHFHLEIASADVLMFYEKETNKTEHRISIPQGQKSSFPSQSYMYNIFKAVVSVMCKSESKFKSGFTQGSQLVHIKDRQNSPVFRVNTSYKPLHKETTVFRNGFNLLLEL